MRYVFHSIVLVKLELEARAGKAQDYSWAVEGVTTPAEVLVLLRVLVFSALEIAEEYEDLVDNDSCLQVMQAILNREAGVELTSKHPCLN